MKKRAKNRRQDFEKKIKSDMKIIYERTNSVFNTLSGH